MIGGCIFLFGTYIFAILNNKRNEKRRTEIS